MYPAEALAPSDLACARSPESSDKLSRPATHAKHAESLDQYQQVPVRM